MIWYYLPLVMRASVPDEGTNNRARNQAPGTLQQILSVDTSSTDELHYDRKLLFTMPAMCTYAQHATIGWLLGVL